MSKIYALCDKSLLKKFDLTLEEFINIAKFYDAKIIQYRDKTSSFEEKKENLKKLKSLSSCPVIVNDYIELAQFCDGVHLGQEDILSVIESFGFSSRYEAIKGIRKIIGKKIVGISTHNEEEIKEANILDIDYIGLGAFRDTSTKDVSNILGKNIEILLSLSKHPVAIIGGVRLFDNITGAEFKAIGSDIIRKWMSYS